MENPSNGVTINVPAAAAVIKDCATLANFYIPHYVFGTYGNPFQQLNKKFTVDQIKDFIKRSEEDFITNQLRVIILHKGRNIVEVPSSPGVDLDPYGDYESNNSPQQKNVDDTFILCKLFGVI